MGALSREQALNLVRLYDGHYPENYRTLFDYYQIREALLMKLLISGQIKNCLRKLMDSGNYFQCCLTHEITRYIS